MTSVNALAFCEELKRSQSLKQCHDVPDRNIQKKKKFFYLKVILIPSQKNYILMQRALFFYKGAFKEHFSFCHFTLKFSNITNICEDRPMIKAFLWMNCKYQNSLL